MTGIDDEPGSDRAARAWIADRVRASDRFAGLSGETERHRAQHGCNAYASADGPLLGVLAGAIGARRILEIGTALGYSAAWLAYGAPSAHVDTIEEDASHAEVASSNLQQAGFGDRVRIRVGRSPDALRPLAPGYDLVFYDAHVPGPAELNTFYALLRPGGLLLTSNLFLGRYDPALPGLEQGGEYRRQLFDPERWLTTFADLKALSVRR